MEKEKIMWLINNLKEHCTGRYCDECIFGVYHAGESDQTGEYGCEIIGLIAEFYCSPSKWSIADIEEKLWDI